MRRFPLLAACVLFAAASARAAEPFILEAPVEATEAELKACVAALGKRFAALGLKGLKADVVTKDGTSHVEVQGAGDIPADVKAKVARIAGFAGKDPAIRFFRELTDAEKAEFKAPGPSGTGGKAPPGVKWFRLLEDDLAATAECRPMEEKAAVRWSDTTVTNRGDKEWTFEISAETSKRFVSDVVGHSGSNRTGTAEIPLGFDDVTPRKRPPLTLTTKKVTFKLPADLAATLEAILRNPMPRALKPKTEAPAEPKK